MFGDDFHSHQLTEQVGDRDECKANGSPDNPEFVAQVGDPGQSSLDHGIVLRDISSFVGASKGHWRRKRLTHIQFVAIAWGVESANKIHVSWRCSSLTKLTPLVLISRALISVG